MTTIRRAGPEDLDRILQWHRSFCLADGHTFQAGRARRALRPLLADESLGVVWLAENDDGGGYAVVTWGWSVESGGRDALLDEIYAEPPGRGIGSRLLEAVIADLSRRGIGTVFLETEISNHPARRLYARHGFVADDSVWMSRSI